jgi:glycosyltransferase involved in cell wall biosynthesis
MKKLDNDDSNRILSLVVPVYNEVKTVIETINSLLKLEFINQIVIVDDGSIDGTKDLLQTLSNNPIVKIVFNDSNKGKGYSLRTGFKYAVGPFVGIQDADLEYDPKDLIKFLPPLINNQADAVFGSRFKSGDVGRVLYFWHSLGNN